MHQLFDKSLIFVSDKNSKEEVFKQIHQQLLLKGDVNESFYTSLIERENSYPTGLDLSPVDKRLNNIAIPHTEPEFVNTQKIVPIKLNKNIKFNNMIDPNSTLDVSFIFLLLNNKPDSQSNLLALIMDFINRTPINELCTFFNMTDQEEIYQFLNTNFLEVNKND